MQQQPEKKIRIDVESEDTTMEEEHKEKKQPLGDTENIHSLDDSEEKANRMIKLISKDKKEFVISVKHAEISKLVKVTLEQDKEATEIILPGVTSETLALIVEYMNHHKGTEPAIIPKPLRAKTMKEVVQDPWDAPFIDETVNKKRQDLYDFILATNYVDIPSALHLGCAKVASMIKGQPLEKIKDILTGKTTEGKTTEESKLTEPKQS